MSFGDRERRRAERERRLRARRRRLAAGSLGLVVVALAAAVALGRGGGGPGSHADSAAGGATSSAASGSARQRGGAHGGRTHISRPSTSTGARATGVPGHATAPILMYHVINPPPAGAPFPGLYVPAGEFAAQMQALRAAGWHAVTMDQLQANWTRGAPLPDKPIVISFDNGYMSQYTNALPVLRALGWVGVENIQLAGLPPSQGGLTSAQVKGLIAAGWELDTQGISHADLIALSPSELRYQVLSARRMLQQEYHVPVHWFCYPSGHYDATVIAEVRAAGYVGSTTVVPGWAGPSEDRFRLPRLRVLRGTSPSALLQQIAQAQGDSPPAPAYGGAAGTPGA